MPPGETIPDLVQVLVEHDYVSTACLHALHDRCRLVCKFCGVGCRCSCHAVGTISEAVERSA